MAHRVGTTTYSGADLLVGGEPAVSPEDRIRPPDQRRDDRLPPQAAAVAVVALLGAGVFLTARTVDPRRRRASPGRPRPRWWSGRRSPRRRSRPGSRSS